MATATTATGRVPTDKADTLETVAAQWVTAKQDEQAAAKVKKAATDIRTNAGRTLAGRMYAGQEVTGNGNRTYRIEIQDNENVVASKVLADLRATRPELARVIADLENEPHNRTSYSKVTLKPVKA